MNRKVLLLSDIVEEGKQILREGGCELIPSAAKELAGRIREMKQYQPAAVITKTNIAVPEALIAADPALRVVSRHGVGVDNIDVAAATKRGVQVTHVIDGNYRSVAEHAMFFILALAKRYGYIHDDMRAGDFDVRSCLVGEEISGRTIGLIGTGHIGKALAKMAQAFSMPVVGYSRHAQPGTITEEGIHMLASRDDVIRAADYLVLCLPSTPETVHSIGAREFGLMKKSAFFINVSRGNIVVEPELIGALQEGEISGAGLDVFDPEPPERTNPLLQMENVIATHHYAAYTTEALRKLAIRSAEQVVQVLDGKEPEFPVN